MRMRRRQLSATLLSAVLLASLATAARSEAALSLARATVFTGYGFDTCAAPSPASLQAWLASPYRALGIYLGGANRTCPDGNLSAAWVTASLAAGWNLAPLYVGLQAPCLNRAGGPRIDPL